MEGHMVDGATGKQKEFVAAVLPHRNILYHYALSLTNNQDDAHDLLQDTYLKAYRFWAKYEQGTNIRGWLYRIMRNSYINQYRKVVNTPTHVNFQEVENFYYSIRHPLSDPNNLEEHIVTCGLSDAVVRALELLPEDWRTVVILCDIEGLPYDEIAVIVDCPVGTVRSRLHRGRKELRAHLYQYRPRRNGKRKHSSSLERLSLVKFTLSHNRPSEDDHETD